MMVTSGQLGRYELLEILGDGGFATVYRAWDPALNREIAVKALHPHLAAQPEVRRRFVAEAQALARLSHPNIVMVYDVGEAGERPYFTMELLRGPTLAKALPAQGGLPWEQTLPILSGIASAIDYLHAAGLIHRDVKASNVVLTGIRPVLMDFGIARSVDEVHHTRTGAALGTPEAMAPEQVRGEEAGPPADVYALGVLAYHLLAGAPPFVGETAYVLYAHAHNPPPPLERSRPGLPAHVYTAIATALAKDPAQRPHSAADFIRMLRGSAVETTAALPGVTPPPATAAPDLAPAPAPVKRRGPPLLLVLGGALLLGMAAMAAAVLLLDGNGNGGATAQGSATVAATISPTGGMGSSVPGPATATATRAPSPSPSTSPSPSPTPALSPSPSPTATAPPGLPLLLRPGEARIVNLVHDATVPARHFPPCTSGPQPQDFTFRLRITRLESPAPGRLVVNYEVEALAIPGVDCRIMYEADVKTVQFLTAQENGTREWPVIEGSGIALQLEAVNIYGRNEFGSWGIAMDLTANEVWLIQSLRNQDQQVIKELHRLRLLP